MYMNTVYSKLLPLTLLLTVIIMCVCVCVIYYIPRIDVNSINQNPISLSDQPVIFFVHNVCQFALKPSASAANPFEPPLLLSSIN